MRTFTFAAKAESRPEDQVSIMDQIVFFAPLAVTTLFMHITLSLFNAGLARLPSPEIYISAYAIAQSFAFLVESFVIPVRQLMSAMISDTGSYHNTKRFVILLSLFSGLLFAFLVFSGLTRWILESIMGVRGRIMEEALTILKLLVVFPVIVAFRNFWQGLLMKLKKTPLVTVGAVVRMVFVGTVFLFIRYLTPVPGGIVAGSLLLGAVLIEGLAMLVGMRATSGSIRQELLQPENVHEITVNDSASRKEVSVKILLAFTVPLILTTLIGTAATPIINMGLARSANPIIALPAFTVGWDLGMIFVSPLSMFHQVLLNCLRGDSSSHLLPVKRFMVYVGFLLTLVLSVVSYTPAGYYLLRNFMGVSDEISLWSMEVLRIMSILPVITIMREFYWGVLIRKHMTRYVVQGKTVNVVVLALSVALVAWIGPANPAMIGAVSMLAGQVSELVYLHWAMRKRAYL